VYTIDGQVMAELISPPFTLQFNTSSYPAGVHELAARVTGADGKEYTTPARTVQFVTQEEQNAGMQKILVPMLGLILAFCCWWFWVKRFCSAAENKTPPWELSGIIPFQGERSAPSVTAPPRCI